MEREDSRRAHDLTLAGMGLAVLVWSAVRACVQSITIDEADTYLAWVRPADTPSHWFAASNNHVLSSALIRLSVDLLGLSHFSMRLPSLVGAALFLCVAYRFVRAFVPQGLSRIAAFACLALSPFFGDYFVAARGYGLALALLFAAVQSALEMLRDGRDPARVVRTCGVVSACLGLSFCANFGFAFSNLAVLTLTFGAACLRFPRAWPRLLAATTAPGMLTVTLIAGWTLLHWPSGQLWYGATGLAEMANSLAKSATYELNNFLVNPLLFRILSPLRSYFFPALALLTAARLGWLLLAQRQDLGIASQPMAFVGSAFVLTTGLHWLAFTVWKLPLPLERTGIQLVLLFLLPASLALAPADSSRFDRGLRQGLLFVVAALALYSFGCQRLNYFHEWKWGADVRAAYDVVAYYHHQHGVTEVPSSWHYQASLNFYRAAARGKEEFAEFRSVQPYPADKQVYVLNAAFDAKFIHEHSLEIVYRGPRSDLVVAVARGFAQR